MSSIITVPGYVHQRVLIVARQQGFGNNPTITYESGSKTGDGYIGLIVRARLIDTKPTARSSLSIICKFPPEDRQQREQFNAMALFEREHFIYQRVLPAFEELQQEHGLGGKDDRHYFGNYPKCYHTYCDTEQGEAVLILEDLTDPGRPALTMLNQYDRVDYDHVRVLMQALGKLNACSFAVKQHRPTLFAELQRLNDLLSIVLDTEQMAPLTPRHCKLAASAFKRNELLPDHRTELLNLATDMWRRTGVHIDGKRAEPYAALNHGDCWTNNVMFGYDAEGQVKDICLLDWQMARYSSPVLDHVLFIYLCGERELRRDKFEPLVQTFYDSFSSTLRRLGGDPEQVLPRDELDKQVKQFGRLALVMGTYALPNFAQLPEEIRRNPEAHQNDERLQNYHKMMRELVEDTIEFDHFTAISQ
ncbi:uncharacterized protein LOC118460786 [Anopheles albimanus]|uniref:CHK kinase-like domain-containing protein n=1 Tax=Anopheles albimanus TaxID=7167 RepID=A0A1I8JST5_ANOAL|nr:uncharacterized protein LOC118460786 [Anopheles albimanus]